MYQLGEFEIAQFRAFEESVDKQYNQVDATILHQIVQKVLASQSIASSDLILLQQILPRVVVKMPNDSVQECVTVTHTQDDWSEWTRDNENAYRKSQRDFTMMALLRYSLEELARYQQHTNEKGDFIRCDTKKEM